MSLYAVLIIGVFIGPLALSFDKKVAFYKEIRFLLLGLIITGAIFLIWDEYFTIKQIWGFNPKYLLGIYLGHLPLEEVLFFIIVPYNCVFVHQVLKAYFPNIKLKNISSIFLVSIAVSSLTLALLNYHNWYTFSTCSLAFILCTTAILLKPKWLMNFSFTYLVCLIPFLFVNGVLTGAATSEPIVWYSESHIIGLRILTIPLEDIYYNFSLLILVIAFFEWQRGKSLS
jgi:lycopene cyclase domain-containing protein